MEDNNDNLSQTSPALQSSEEQGSKPKDSSKIITIICAILALAGIGFGVYGMTRKPEDKPVENNIAELEDELSALRQKHSVLQNYIKELEASGAEVPEEAKSATETAVTIKNPVVINANVKDSQHDDYVESYSIRTTGPANANGVSKYWILSSANGDLTCKINDQEYGSMDNAENCDMSAHNGKVSSIYYTHLGNGGGSYMLILMENGDVEYLSDLQGEQYNTIRKLSLSDKVTRIYAGVNTCSVLKDYSAIYGGCGVTALLVYADGSIVDLHDVTAK